MVFANRNIYNNFNYDKGGDDWTGECQTGNQSPIDINAPFVFKSIIKINKINKRF
jgi:hypothetical protein